MRSHASSPPANFEQAIGELQQIVEAMESGELGFEESVRRYGRGQLLLQYCQGVLQHAESRVMQIAEGTGGLAVEPLLDLPIASAGEQPPEP